MKKILLIFLAFLSWANAKAQAPAIQWQNTIGGFYSDGNNDILFVRENCIKSLNFIILDRWGEKVFESNDISNGWDGKYKGKELNSAVFVYQCDITLINGEKRFLKGDVSLIKN